MRTSRVSEQPEFWEVGSTGDGLSTEIDRIIQGAFDQARTFRWELSTVIGPLLCRGLEYVNQLHGRELRRR